MAKESTYGTTAQCMMDTGSRTRLMVQVFTSGLMEENMMVNGRTITCMVGEFTPGKMVEGMKESTLMTESMGMEYMCGQTADNIWADGRTVSNTEKVFINRPMVLKEEEYGKTERESNGLMNESQKFNIFLILSYMN